VHKDNFIRSALGIQIVENAHRARHKLWPPNHRKRDAARHCAVRDRLTHNCIGVNWDIVSAVIQTSGRNCGAIRQHRERIS
jgi:hypothetical protein